MSENIQSISMGTYTIGSTSATNFVAGPGIKIDEPSAGTVRIGNDETVLWSGAGTLNGCTFSESKDNFERLKVYCYADEQTTAKQQIVEVPTSNTGLPLTLWYANGSVSTYPYVVYRTFYRLNPTGILPNDGSTSGGHAWLSPTWAVGGTSTTPSIKITKVVGINRISGSNA